MAFNCWLCEDTFGTKRELKLHVSGPQHLRMKVVCPYCVESEVTSNRIGDLQKHIKRTHPSLAEQLPDGFFSERAGFYLSVYPVDYLQIVTPLLVTSPIVTCMKNAVKLWLTLVTGASRSASEWQVGWAQGDCTPLREEGLNPTTMIPTIAPYSPTRPSINVTVGPLTIFNETVTVPIKSVGEIYSLTLTRSVPKSILKNLQKSQKDIDIPRLPRTEIKGNEYAELATELGEALGISECFIDQIDAYRPSVKLPTPFPTFSTDNISEQAVIPTPSASLPTSPKIQTEVPPIISITPLQKAARGLLTTGSMPSLAPARREWTGEHQVVLKGRLHQVSWPPRGWKSMDPARRQQVSHHAASLLDCDSSGFPLTKEEDIMDRYNFLILPGSLSSRARTPRQIMRRYNYDQLRQVAVGTSTDSELLEAWCIPTMRQTKFLEEVKHIPLRL